ncbi:GerAB/ArcD/ProY family transporter [Brassicibacter mesophilus]|uniref:GerAB/ArcD/ProY family transporter n=1 Tax=Brassicibacter mesophilus TaxID=745119 RepID=UPI003D1A8B24
MDRNVISDRQGISLIILFLIGTSSIHTTGLQAERDLWLAIIISILMALPIVIIYARLHYLFPNQGLYDIIELCFGKFIGKVIIILFSLYIFNLSALVLRSIVQFINVTAISETPIIIPSIAIIIICIFAIKEGIEVLGRMGEVFAKIPIIFIIILVLLLIPNINLSNAKPILYNGMKPVFRGALSVLSFPLLDTVAFTMVFTGFKEKKSSYKIYVYSIAIGGLMLLTTSTIDLLVLGINAVSIFYYPTHTAVTRIDIGMIIQRVEVIAAIIFILGGFIKISICLLATSNGVAKIFRCKDYRFIVIPVSLLVLNLSYFEFDSIMSYVEWTKLYPLHDFLFEIILPFIILIAAEVKKKKIINDLKII